MASVPELERIVIGVVAGSLLAAAIVYALGWAQAASFQVRPVMDGFPRSFWISELLVSLAVLGGVRFAIRAAAEREYAAGRLDREPPSDAALWRGRDRPHHRQVGAAQPRTPASSRSAISMTTLTSPASTWAISGCSGASSRWSAPSRQSGRRSAADHDAASQREGGPSRRGCGHGPRSGRADRAFHQRPARRHARRAPGPLRPGRGPAPPTSGHRACRRRPGDHRRSNGRHHRRRRVDRIRACPPGPRARSATPGARGSRRKPAVHDPAGARDAEPRMGWAAASCARTSSMWPVGRRWIA